MRDQRLKEDLYIRPDIGQTDFQAGYPALIRVCQRDPLTTKETTEVPTGEELLPFLPVRRPGDRLLSFDRSSSGILVVRLTVCHQEA